MNSYRKAKSVAKDMNVVGPKLVTKVLETMRVISDIVGATLGPSGRPVLIERQEYGLPHMFTKDGVTVFRNLGFADPTQHAIMEAARDAATRTVSEAGDGTTTATVLADAIVSNTHQFCEKNPKISPQKVVRKLEKVFSEVIEPEINKLTVMPSKKDLFNVAKLSANGDGELAEAVMKCFDLIGDDGNISIIEQSGPSHYEVQTLKGYPVSMGFEESCGKFFPLFLNDKANNRTYLEKPVFVLYFGSITQIQTVERLMQEVARAWQTPQDVGLDKPFNYNVVLVATGFSETVLGDLSVNFSHPHTINVFPLLTPKTPQQNGEMHFLHDLSAITGAKVFDPMSNPLDTAQLSDLGYGIQSFECTRYRSTILGISDPTLVELRHEEVLHAARNAESKFDQQLLEERAAKLVGGVAKIIVVGPSSGELREKRDRVEDAICSVRGAIKKGFLPGGGWAFKKLIERLSNIEDPVVQRIMIPSLEEPFLKMMRNCGLNEEEIHGIWQQIGTEDQFKVYDAWENKFVNAIDGGILDSTPAVLEAIRNSISIATLLGTIGGTVVYQRDMDMEKKEAMDATDFMRTVGA